MQKKPKMPRPILAASRQLRRDATTAEQILWDRLRNRQVAGLKFRRQAVIERRFVADFYCHENRLIIELDGSIHNLPDVQAADEERQQWLEAAGYTVIRFTNRDIRQNLDQVLADIVQHTEDST
jgi:very-short-patch-repair endonuclease